MGYISNSLTLVPNVPCGVESSMALRQSEIKDLFLMYRVELKGDRISWLAEGNDRS